jgi:pimeloyl-ACP methyl ester carboxylesterase
MRNTDVIRGSRRLATWVDDGPAVGAPIIALHGGPGFAHDYLTAPFASGYGRQSVQFDWPGSGLSSRHPGSGYPLEEYVADVEAIRESTGARRAVLFAHAWAAIPAVEYAIAFPDRYSALVLVNPLRILTIESQDHEAQARRIAAVDPRVTEPYVQDLWPVIQRAIAGDLAAWDAVDASPWWARMWRTQFLSPPPAAWTAAVAGTRWGLESYFAHKGRAMMDPTSPLATYDLAIRVAELGHPVLIVGSDSDANYVAPVEVHAAPLHAAAPGNTLAIIRESGHFPFIDQPAEYGSIVSRFLARLPTDSRNG